MAEEAPPLQELKRAGRLPETGACWNCGFFCHKDEHNRHISSYAELTTHNREWGRFFPLMERWAPWCFRYEPVLPEIAERLGHEPRVVIQDETIQSTQNAAAMEVAIKDRQCVKWTKYRPGLSPKDHWDEQFMRELEQMRRANDLKIAELDQRSQESMRAVMADQVKITETIKDIAEQSSRESSFYQRAFIVLAIIALLLALAPLAYPSGVDWLVDNLPGQPSTPTQ